MRHIPEDELHAYLDQGLSRTQCVEIESHLADCPSCQATRDGIAALRDRTTALLARLAPPPRVPPAFERPARAGGRRGRVTGAAGGCRWSPGRPAWSRRVGLGWGASSLARSGEPARRRLARRDSAPAAASRLRRPPPRWRRAREPPAAVAGSCPTPARPAAPARRAGRPAARGRASARGSVPSPRSAAREAALSVLNPTPALELTRLERPQPARTIELDGMWRTMSWDGAKAEAGERLPHIDGLPVVQVQVQSGEQGARPVMVVAQQLSSGQVIRTIEGPATDVSQLLSRRVDGRRGLAVPARATPAGSGPTRGHAMAMQVGDRMLAITGDLPVRQPAGDDPPAQRRDAERSNARPSDRLESETPPGATAPGASALASMPRPPALRAACSRRSIDSGDT